MTILSDDEYLQRFVAIGTLPRVSIGFTSSPSEISKVIRTATRAKVSHAYIVVDNLPVVGHEVYEAAWVGFRMATRAKVGTIIKEVPVDVNVTLAVATLRDWLETPYDYAGLFGELPVCIGRLFGRRWKNPWASAHHMFCSEAATYLLQIAGNSVDLKRKIGPLDARSTSPEDLLQALESQ